MEISRSGLHEVSLLFSSQEETDTRILLHSVHLATDHDRLLIVSDDTEVLVLSVL